MAFSTSNGRRLPRLIASLYDRDSRIRQGRKNFSWISWCHCLRRLAGVMTRIAPLAFGPFLRDDQARLDGLAQTDLICQHRPLRQWRMKGEQSGFDLVRIQIDLGVNQRAGQLLDAIGRAPLGQFMSEILGVVGSQAVITGRVMLTDAEFSFFFRQRKIHNG